MKKVAKFLRKFLPALALLSALTPRTATANTFLTDAWLLQGGNLFGDNVTVGTLDAFDLIFYRAGVEQGRFGFDGSNNTFTVPGARQFFGTVGVGATRLTIQGLFPGIELESNSNAGTGHIGFSKPNDFVQIGISVEDPANCEFFFPGTLKFFKSGTATIPLSISHLGDITAIGSTHIFGKVGTATTFTVGQGTTGTDTSKIVARSGNSGTTAPTIALNRNGTDISQWTFNGTDTFLDQTGNLTLRTGIAGTAYATLAAGTDTWGVAGTALTFTVGQGTTGADATKIVARSGNTGTTAPTVALNRNGTDISQWTFNGTDTFFDYGGTLTFRSGIAGTTFLTESSAGLLTNIGHVLLDNTGTASELRLREPSASGSEYSSFKSVAMGANANYSLPPDDGTSGQFLRTDGVGVLTWVTASGSGDVTSVGPGCLTGDCWTNGLATTGSVLLVWEGTTVNGTDFTMNVPADPNFSIAWTVLNAATDLTFPSGTDTVVARDSTDTLTGKTLNVESTGNIVTTVEKIWLPAASCSNTSAASNWDTTSNTQPLPGCTTGTNTVKGVLSFDDATDEAVQTHIMLPADWTGNIDARIKWYGSALTNAVGWCIQLACAADGEVDDPAFPAQSAANCVSDTAKGTANQSNDVTITNITPGTGGGVCAAGELMHVRWSRDANGSAVTDSFVGDANGIGVELTLRRAQ